MTFLFSATGTLSTVQKLLFLLSLVLLVLKLLKEMLTANWNELFLFSGDADKDYVLSLILD